MPATMKGSSMRQYIVPTLFVASLLTAGFIGWELNEETNSWHEQHAFAGRVGPIPVYDSATFGSLRLGHGIPVVDPSVKFEDKSERE